MPTSLFKLLAGIHPDAVQKLLVHFKALEGKRCTRRVRRDGTTPARSASAAVQLLRGRTRRISSSPPDRPSTSRTLRGACSPCSPSAAGGSFNPFLRIWLPCSGTERGGAYAGNWVARLAGGSRWQHGRPPRGTKGTEENGQVVRREGAGAWDATALALGPLGPGGIPALAPAIRHARRPRNVRSRCAHLALVGAVEIEQARRARACQQQQRPK
jgi:hypothetical protein